MNNSSFFDEQWKDLISIKKMHKILIEDVWNEFEKNPEFIQKSLENSKNESNFIEVEKDVKEDWRLFFIKKASS